jgi:hypothetical protein
VRIIPLGIHLEHLGLVGMFEDFLGHCRLDEVLRPPYYLDSLRFDFQDLNSLLLKKLFRVLISQEDPKLRENENKNTEDSRNCK